MAIYQKNEGYNELIIEKYKQQFSNKLFKIILLAVLVVLIILYFKTFFTLGVYFNDTFLKKEVLFDETHYTGKSKYGDIQIIVKGEANELRKCKAEVSYHLPNNINKIYTVYYNHEKEWLLGTLVIKDEKDKTIFDGRYQKGSLFLYDNNNKPLIEENIGFFTGTAQNVTYDAGYKIPLKSVVEFSLLEKEELRGNIGLLFYAIILLIITIIDIKSPLFFFTLSHCLDVKDPEPTDFYITMQKISWVIMPIIALIMLIVAI